MYPYGGYPPQQPTVIVEQVGYPGYQQPTVIVEQVGGYPQPYGYPQQPTVIVEQVGGYPAYPPVVPVQPVYYPPQGNTTIIYENQPYHHHHHHCRSPLVRIDEFLPRRRSIFVASISGLCFLLNPSQ
jgi:hypothetical protein